MATPDERRARWEKSLEQKIALGFNVETDPAFLGWIEEWIAGKITIHEVQRRYAGFNRLRYQSSPIQPDVNLTGLLEKLREGIPELGDLPLQETGERTQTSRTIDAAWDIDE
ncbi:hypothetical protein [Pararhizobium qamdonense]|uniref:hypothetical protein n=1 Tax=Pararhizobium qamdonense TaxID=3031126 RepID=UPI0023E0E43D|nr:hypothetical protein [Pararhizobium qamdonense]